MKLATLLLLVLPAIFQAQQPFNIEKENALGTQLAADLRRHTKPLANQAVQAYARRLANRLSGRDDWHVEVVTGLPKRPTEELRWFPGNYIFIPAELFLKAQSEDELAGMLAHAIAHETAHDLTRATVPSLGSIPLVFVGWGDPLVVPQAVLAMRRKREIEADATAIQLLRNAGDSPQGEFQAIQTQVRAELPLEAPRQKPSLFK